MLAGIYQTKDGWVRPHTNWLHHKLGLLKLLDLPVDAKKADVAGTFAGVSAHEFAELAMVEGLPVASLRTFEEW